MKYFLLTIIISIVIAVKSQSFFANLSYFGNSAVDFGETV